MSEILLALLNVLLVGAGLAVVGLLVVRLMRAALGEPETTDNRPGGKGEEK